MNDSLLRILKKYLETIKFDDICGYSVIIDDEGDDLPQVIIKIDKNYLDNSSTKPDYLVSRIKRGLHEDLTRLLGLEFDIGTMIVTCSNQK